MLTRGDYYMGTIRAEVDLSNPTKPELKPLKVNALVDTGAMTICIPEHVATQLQLREIEKREVRTADERTHVVPYVGPLQINFENRTSFTGALIIGESVFLGAISLEDMDLVISPSGQTITVNPQSPNIPSAIVK
jgi:clan AA aspartic protease